MTLIINGRFLTRPGTGVDRVAENVVLGLDRIWPEAAFGRYIVAVPQGGHRTLALRRGDIVPDGRWRGAAWEQFDLPRLHPSAVIFNPCNTAPLLHRRNVVVIHDANPFDYPASYSAAFRAWYRFLLPRLARRALRVVTVSEHSAHRLMAHSITARPAAVVPNGCDHFGDQVSAPVSRRKMVLFAGSPAPHKNLDLFVGLARAFEAQGVAFVVAGAVSGTVFAASRQTSPPPANLSFLGRVSEMELVTAYREAAVLVFPSFVEGFGLTPLEAQSFGCPVISSDRAPMTETLGGSALYADPGDLSAWVSATGHVLNDTDLAARLSQAGLANAARYSWARASAQYLELIASALATAEARPGSGAPAIIRQRAERPF
jgi:glycosyltransferase involved in cell wall biosynthesis